MPSRGASLLPVTVAALTFATISRGGFHWPQGSLLAVILVLACSAAPARSFRAIGPGLSAAGSLAAGLVASAAANGWPQEARQPLATLAIAVAALVVGRSLIVRGERHTLLAALALIGVLAAIIGMAGLAVHWYPLAMRAQGIWRTSSTLTYANSAGAFLTLTLFAAIAVASERRNGTSRMAVAVILAGLITSLSRGGILGAAAGAAVVTVAGGRDLFRGLARPAVAALILSACLVPSIASDRGRPLIAIVGLGVALAVAATPRMRPGRRWRATGIAAAVMLTGCAVLLASQNAGRLFESRLAPGSEDRIRTWHATWSAAMERPLLGTGPGTFRIVEMNDDGAILTRYAHNEYLQAFAETGVGGVASIAVALVILGGWMRRRRPGAGAERGIWALALGACVAFAAHSAVDFVWRIPVLVAIAFLWLSLCVIRPEGVIEDERSNDAA